MNKEEKKLREILNKLDQKDMLLVIKYIYGLERENERLKEILVWKQEHEKELHTRISKAIEYLEQPYRDNFDYSKAELLNILQNGSDKE